jgi:hypothetical protein
MAAIIVTTIRGVIDYVDSLKPNSYTDAQKLVWINEVEQYIKEEVMRTYLKSTIARVSGTADYDLPITAEFEDIETVYIDGVRVSVLDSRNYIDGTYGDLGYYKSETLDHITICPTPQVTDDSNYPGIQISYLERFVEYTDEDDYDTDLLIQQSRYAKIYTFYIMAQIDLFNKEYENYNNMMNQYNSIMNDYKTWYDSRLPKDITDTVVTIF